MLTVRTGKNKSTMSPVKWVTPISKENPMIALSLMDGDIARSVIKQKAFTLAMVHRDYIGDVIRTMNNPNPKLSRLTSEPAFFIDGYKAHGFPWVECKVYKFLNVPDKTILVAAKVVHVSKKSQILTDRIIHCKDQTFINNIRISVTKYDRNGIKA